MQLKNLSLSMDWLRIVLERSTVNKFWRCFCKYCGLVFLFILLPAGQEGLANLPDSVVSQSTSLTMPASFPAEVQHVAASRSPMPLSVSMLAGLPQYFIANTGQVDPQVLYYTKGSGHSMYFTADGVHFVLRSAEDESLPDGQVAAGKSPQQVDGKKESGSQHSSQPGNIKVHSAQLTFIGANPDPVIEAEQPLAGRVNYLIGDDPGKWHKDIPTYGSVVYRELYPGIDVRFYGKQGTLEYDVIVAPGADPGQVRFRYEGADRLTLNDDGDLVIALGEGELIQRKPVVYQDIDGQRNKIEAVFTLAPATRTVKGNDGAVTVGFQLATYDADQPLFIDPVLNFSSYLGGASSDDIYAVAVEEGGRFYVAGSTKSDNFPLANPYQGTYGGIVDAFVARLSADGQDLEYATYLGGSAGDIGWGVAVDSAGRAYVVGVTDSDDFPLASSYQETLGGGDDAFVARLTADGQDLEYATYLGGNLEDVGWAVAVDGAGRAYVVGETSSDNFPLANPYQSTYGGVSDAFVARLAADGQALEYATYLGGNDTDGSRAVAVDDAGRAYVAGRTASVNFPLTNPYQSTPGGVSDAFVARLAANGQILDYATYLGGSADDNASAIAVDGAGRAYVAGSTASVDFPLANPYQPTPGGGGDAFVTRLAAGGQNLEYATYLGGSANERGLAVAVDGAGRAYVAGETASVNFPLANPYQGTRGGGDDAFVARLAADGQNLEYATYLGGNDTDGSRAVAVDGAGRAYVAGWTLSNDFPLVRPFQGTPGGGRDAFVAMFGPPPPPDSDTITVLHSPVAEQRPAVAYNTQLRESLVAYLIPSTISAGYFELRLQRYDFDGNPIGGVIDPFGGFGGLLYGIGRPDIAYSPTSNSYLVAVPRMTSIAAGESAVMAIQLDAEGDYVADVQLFEEADGSVIAENDASPVRVIYNSTRDEFLVSFQQDLENRFIHKASLLAQRVRPDITLAGAVSALYESRLDGINPGFSFDTHSIAYAPVAGGRYVVAIDSPAVVSLVDADLNSISPWIDVNIGEPTGGEYQPDMAFGRIAGQDRVLMVWWDSNNCRIGVTVPCASAPEWDKRFGVWGVFIDPAESAPPQAVGQPFPILTPDWLRQFAYWELAVKPFMPRVAYNPQGRNFYVAWREIPLEWGNNDAEVRTHIRGAWVDYPVEDVEDAGAAPLNNNVIISPVSGNCPAPAPVPGTTDTCPSREDPYFPDVAALDGFGAVVVWQQAVDYDTATPDIGLRAFLPTPPANDQPADATDLTTTSLHLEGTLLGAGIDAVASCGAADEEPDVWYAFTAPGAGQLQVNTCTTHDLFGEDTGTDTVLSLHRPDGSQFDGACNDSAPRLGCGPGDLGSVADAKLSNHILYAGEQVLVRVSRSGGTSGAQFVLNNSFEVLADGDSDGYADVADNCIQVANTDQRDTDYDGYGNLCDGDLNNDGNTNTLDLNLYKLAHRTSVGDANYNVDADFNGDGRINTLDLNIYKGLHRKDPGPSCCGLF